MPAFIHVMVEVKKMNLEKFKELNQKQLEATSGGFWQLIALALPFIMQSVSQTVASIKMITSDSGSVKYQGYESKWESEAPKTSKASDSAAKQIVYAY